jgi:hypothetical protein
MDIKIILDNRGLNKAIKRVPNRVRREIGDGMDRIGKGFLKRWRKARLHGPPGVRGKSGHGLFGTFKRASIFGKSIDDMGVHIWSDSKVAQVHEEGGDVTAKGGGRLAVPLSAREQMFTAGGKLRKRFKRPGKLRNVVPMRWRGKTFLVKTKKRDKEILPLYVLKEKVRLKPRLEFLKTWNSLTNYRTKIINDKIKIALREL